MPAIFNGFQLSGNPGAADKTRPPAYLHLLLLGRRVTTRPSTLKDGLEIGRIPHNSSRVSGAEDFG